MMDVMVNESNHLIDEILLKFVELMNIKLNADGSFEGSIGDWDKQQLVKDIANSRELDETGLTTFMLLRGTIEQRLKTMVFTAHDFLTRPDYVQRSMAATVALHKELADPFIVSSIDAFTRKIRSTALNFGFEKIDELERLLANSNDLAWVRRNALVSMQNLKAHQFTQGQGEKTPLQLNPGIYEFWNVNSLVRALQAQQIPGVSICLIRDSQALWSYFVFAVKNGDVITVLTDKQDDPHPAFRKMTRNPSRTLKNRMDQHLFPYQLLDLEEDSRGRFQVIERTQLVPLNIDLVKLCEFKDLDADQFIWAILVLELIRDKYWKENHQLPELSYTGEMVVEPLSLVGAESALIKTGAYKPLELPPLKPEDISAESTATQWGNEPTGFNHWMEERYAAQVPETVLNVIGEEKQKLLPAALGLTENHFGETHDLIKFEMLDPQQFGTATDIDRDRKWAARVNQCRMMQTFAVEEFERERQSVIDWYVSHVKDNREFLIDVAVQGELIAPVWRPKEFGSDVGLYKPNKVSHEAEGNIVRHMDNKLWTHDNKGDVVFGDWLNPKGWMCCLQPTNRASFYAVFTPTTPGALAKLAGVTIDELPWPLQNWYKGKPYVGNPILDRLDPEDWTLKNPWAEHLSLTVTVCMCKPAFKARLKILNKG